MHSPLRPPTSRLDIVDALRGSALFGILILHAIEHWDVFRYPTNAPLWLQQLNIRADNYGTSLFSGKAYAIFALMFGLSFYLILNSWSQKKLNFQGRFVWRLTLLGLLGYLNGLIYSSDILLVIAVLGMPLILLNRLGNRALSWVAFLLALQLPSLWETGRVFFESGYQPAPPRYPAINEALLSVYENGSFLDVIKANLWQGQLSRIWCTIETGRHTQMLALFTGGLLLARARVFEIPSRSVRFAKRALCWGLIGFGVIHAVRLHVGDWGLIGGRLDVVHNLLLSYNHLALAAVWIGGFVLLYQWDRPRKFLSLLEPMGRMSLTCYVTQGLVSVPLFYGFGLALYRILGPFYSVLYGLGFFLIQCLGAHLWLKHFQYGPLEWLWRSATFMTFKAPFRKREHPSSAGNASPGRE